MKYKLRDFVEAVSETEPSPQDSQFDRFVGLEHYDSGEIEITRYTDTSLLSSSVKIFHANDILIARRNVYLKRAGIVFFDGLTSGDSIILRVLKDCERNTEVPYQDALRWLPLVLNSSVFWAYANKHADGMNSKRISKEMLLDYEFNAPSITTIRSIANKVWSANSLKKNYRKLLGLTDEMVKSQFIEMFSDVPKVGINTLVDTIWGSSPDSKTYNDTGEGVPFYQGKTEFGDLYINAPVTFCTAPVKMAKANAILMSVRAPVGAVNIATQDCCIGRGLASITPKEGKSTTMFIYFALKYMEEDIDRLGTGSTFKAINKESYAKIQMPNAEISDQAKFVSIAEQADKSKFELKQAIEKIDKVMRALLQ